MKPTCLKIALVQFAGLLVIAACSTSPAPEHPTAVRGLLAAQVENPVVPEEDETVQTSDGVRALARLDAYRSNSASTLEAVATTQSGSTSSVRSGLKR